MVWTRELFLPLESGLTDSTADSVTCQNRCRTRFSCGVVIPEDREARTPLLTIVTALAVPPR